MTLPVTPPAGEHWRVVTASGEIDLVSAAEVRHTLLEAMNAGHQQIVLDLSEVTFVDSSGLAVVVGALRRLREQGGDLRLVSDHPAVRSTIEVCGLHTIMGLYRDVATASTDVRAELLPSRGTP